MPTNKEEHENLMMMVGRLLEAAKVTSETIKTLGDESRENTAAVTRAMASITSLQLTVTEVDRIVRSGVSGGDSIVTQVKILVDEQIRLRDDIDKLVAAHKLHQEQTNKLNRTASFISGGKQLIFLLAFLVFQCLMLGATIYGAIK